MVSITFDYQNSKDFQKFLSFLKITEIKKPGLPQWVNRASFRLATKIYFLDFEVAAFEEVVSSGTFKPS